MLRLLTNVSINVSTCAGLLWSGTSSQPSTGTLSPILLLLAFAACMFLLYSLFPVVIKWSSAIVVNLSILTADMYSLLFGLFLFQFTVRFCLEL